MSSELEVETIRVCRWRACGQLTELRTGWLKKLGWKMTDSGLSKTCVIQIYVQRGINCAY